MKNDFPLLSSYGGKSLCPFNGITKKFLIDGEVKVTDVKLDEVTVLFVGYYLDVYS